MADPFRLCVYSTDPEMDLSAPFQELDNVEIVGQLSTWVEVKDWVLRGTVNLVAVNLDDDDSVAIVERIATASPTCGIIGVSSRTDPDTIIQAMRAGCSQFVRWPVDEADLRTALGRLQAARTVGFQESKRICVVGASGGAGATIVACNLAVELAELTNQRCALIDMNLELGDVGCSFDIQPNYSVADVCRDGAEVDEVLFARAAHELSENVSVLVRPEKVEEAQEISPEGIESMLAVAKENFSFVVVDLPRWFGLLSVTAVRDTNKVLIVTELTVSSIRNATRMYEWLCQTGAPEDSLEIVLNRCKADFAQLTIEDVQTHFGKPFFAMIPNDYRRIRSSLDIGRPIMREAPRSPARLAIQEMARNLASEIPGNPTATPSNRGGAAGSVLAANATSQRGAGRGREPIAVRRVSGCFRRDDRPVLPKVAFQARDAPPLKEGERPGSPASRLCPERLLCIGRIERNAHAHHIDRGAGAVGDLGWQPEDTRFGSHPDEDRHPALQPELTRQLVFDFVVDELEWNKQPGTPLAYVGDPCRQPLPSQVCWNDHVDVAVHGRPRSAGTWVVVLVDGEWPQFPNNAPDLLLDGDAE